MAFWATVAGLIVGVIGFRVTLKQIRQVKTATQAAEEAIRSLKLRFASFDAIQECAYAQHHLDALRTAISRTDTIEAVPLYDKLAISFINLAESASVSESLVSDLRSSSDRVGTIIRGLDTTQTQAGQFSIAKHLEIAREFHALLMRVRFEIHREQ